MNDIDTGMEGTSLKILSQWATGRDLYNSNSNRIAQVSSISPFIDSIFLACIRHNDQSCFCISSLLLAVPS